MGAHNGQFHKERQLLDLVDRMERIQGAVPRIEALVDGITALLDAEVGTFNHFDLPQRRAFVLMRPPRVPDPSTPTQRTLSKHPILNHYRRVPTDRYPQRLSDHVRGGWQDQEVYKLVLEPIGTPYQIVIPIPWKGRMSIASAYAVTRSRIDFNDDHLRFAHAIQSAVVLLHRSEPELVAAGRFTVLTDAERDVLERIARGMTAQQVAISRGTQVSTVRRQRHTAYGKLGVHDRATITRLLGYGPTVPRPVDRLREYLDR